VSDRADISAAPPTGWTQQGYAWERLREPFSPLDLEWRVQRSGAKNGRAWAMVLAYITNRAVMDRLDEVFGPACWQNEYREGPGGGLLCGISANVVGEWVTKWDGAENTDVEAIKGGLSGAMKRAAVQWGIGRYLYNLSDTWAVVSAGGTHRAKVDPKNTDDNKAVYFKWDAPELPAWAIPAPEPFPAEPEPEQAAPKPPPKKRAKKSKAASGEEITAWSERLTSCTTMDELAKAWAAVNKVKGGFSAGQLAGLKKDKDDSKALIEKGGEVAGDLPPWADGKPPEKDPDTGEAVPPPREQIMCFACGKVPVLIAGQNCPDCGPRA